MEAERDAMAERAAGGGRAAGAEALAARQEAVDADARKVRAAAADVELYSTSLRLAVGNVLNRVDDLPALRTASARLGPGVIIDKYTEFVDDFTSFHILISQDAPTAELAQSALALADLANAKDAASRERALLSSALWEGRFEPLDRAAVDDARADMNTSISAFRSSATPAQLRLYEDTVTGPELDRAEVTRLQTLAVADSSRQLQVRLGVRTARSWTADSTARVDKLRAVEKRIAADLAASADDARTGAQTAAIRDGVLLFLVLAVVLATLIVMARSLVRPLRGSSPARSTSPTRACPAWSTGCATRRPPRAASRSSRSRSTPPTRSARSRGRSTRSTARRSGWPPTRPCCAATSTRCSSTSPAAASP
ncbi:nitrate- and nitrite sensing domain-containing protein [Actinomadura luteofluorescens]